MNKSLKIGLISGALLSCCAFYMYGIPAIVNIESHKTLIENKIYETSGYRFDIGQPKLSMGRFPTIWIKSNNISLLNDDNSVALSVDNPKLKLKLLPLLRKKIKISHLSADKEEVNFVYSKDSKFQIGQYPLTMPESKSNYVLYEMKLNLGEYKISLDDQLNNKNLTLNGEYFKHGKYVQNKQLKFGTRAVFNAEGKSTNLYTDFDINLPIDRLSEDKLKIEADIENFDLSQISDYLNTLTEGTVKSAGGIFNFHANTQKDEFGHKNIDLSLTTNNLNIEGKDKPSSIIYNDKLSLKTSFSTVDNGVLFNSINLNSDKINFNAGGKLYNLGHKSPKYDITAEVKNTRIEDVVAIIPGSETLLPDFNLYKLKKYVFYGDADGKLHFKGEGNRPNVIGDIHLKDAYLIHTIKGAPANADVKLKFNGNNMDVNVFVPTGEGQKVIVKGNALIDGSKYSELNIESTDSVSLAPAQEILNPLHEILKFQLGPVPMMKMAGFGNIKLRSAGKKIDPHIWGEINFRNATASFVEINNMELHNGSGEVIFDDTKVTFKTKSGTINGRPVEINGDCAVLGKLNVYVNTKSQDIQKLIKIINTSPILVDVQKVVKPFTKPSGLADVFLHIYGTAKNAEQVKFNEDLFAKGKITLHNATTTMQDTFLPFTKVNGVVNFDQYNSDYDVTGNLRGSELHVWGTGSNNEIDLKANSKNFEISDIFDTLHPDMSLPYKNDIGKIHAEFDATYKGSANASNIDYKKIKANGNFINNIHSSNTIRLNGGTFNITNGFLSTSQLDGFFNNNPITLSFTAKDLDKETMNITDAKFNFKNFDISSINTIKHQIKLQHELKKLLDDTTDIEGTTDIAGTIKNNNIYADTNLANTSFFYKPINSNVNILSGKASVRGNVLNLDKIRASVGLMPLYVDGRMANIYTNNPALNLSVYALPNQQFIDRAFNSNSVYPLKVKGDISFRGKILGTLKAIEAKTNLRLGKNSSIYYMGTTISGNETKPETGKHHEVETNSVSILSDMILSPTKLKINSFRFAENIVEGKSNTFKNFLTASGDLIISEKKLSEFKNLKIKTTNPTDARLFNILFKKPTIKQGYFTSDLTINGNAKMPYAIGTINIDDIGMPILDATLQDIDLNFQKDYIYLDAKGTVLTNEILAKAKIENKQSTPITVEDFNITTNSLNLNVLTSALSELEADNTRASKLKSGSEPIIKPDILIIKNGEITADNILIKKASATNFKTHLTLNENQDFNIDTFNFDIANGNVSGNIKYNLTDFNANAYVKIDGADASIIAENFFDMTGQVYGLVTGELNAKCTGINSLECLSSLNGNGQFEVADGRMPKLGSLEYLLKAGNLISGGVTGVSINSIIDLITPLKTGNFKSINGTVNVENGIAKDINIYSSGKDLNLYITGNYNLSTLVADMEVYGSLSKNFSTLLGKIANSSLNTLFNTIPGVKINEINPKSTSNIHKIPNFDKANVLRVFKAEIFGDINGNNYVRSFRWIKD